MQVLLVIMGSAEELIRAATLYAEIQQGTVARQRVAYAITQLAAVMEHSRTVPARADSSEAVQHLDRPNQHRDAQGSTGEEPASAQVQENVCEQEKDGVQNGIPTVNVWADTIRQAQTIFRDAAMQILNMQELTEAP